MPAQNSWPRRSAKIVLFLACLLPIAILMYQYANDLLSANPLDDITDTTGTWTLRFVMLTLAVTPLRKVTGWSSLGRFRRMIGLFAFFYGALHLTTYLWLDKFFEWEEVIADIVKRPFITVGVASLLLMVPLALTSFDKMIKWMGGKRWRALHRLVYLTGIGGVIHYLWLVKADIQRPLTYGAILAILLSYRVWDWFRARRTKVAVPTSKGQVRITPQDVAPGEQS